MKNLFNILIVFLISGASIAQEPENPFQDINKDDLGNVTDAFQESFFEALKQKGIENYDKAITALEKCREIDPNKAVVYFELGRNYRELENYRKASENLQKSLELQPNNEPVLVYLYETYGLAENYSEAIQVLKKLIPLDQDYEEDLANLYFLNQEFDQALSVLDRLDQQRGADSYRNKLRRQIYTRTNNTGAQIENLQKNISDNPEEEQNYLNLIYMYSEQGDEEEAFRVAQELLDSHPGSSLAHLALYKFYLNRNEPEQAIESMKIVFESEEIDVESKFKVLNDFLNFVEENPEYEEELVAVSAELNQLENATGLFEKLGDFYLKKSDKEHALQFYEMGVEDDPGNFELAKNTILLQIDFQQYQQAAELSANALEIFPSQPIFYLLRGVAFNNLNNFEEAETVLKEGLDYLIDDRKMEIDFYTELAKAYNGMKNEENASEYLQKAKSLEQEID
ncbi:tetratricopeptide repeat protein [Christiangramia flava]|uniref:TPR domain protein n=1 Tax=Christiangramia flava JLT2011 TaxID=1229726 RepID=A0A1L7I363_9FLAO|nr:tetratricopeptide repeat protein [Christiangramia flava]APU68058.1 TPR domain protein [Christiangramia flava JLT2011]OSS40560.1 TPR domain protein [Christiangramia flava JLT2011]